MTSEPRILRQSQINTFLKCSRQWYYRYALGIVSPPGAAMSFGSSAHRAVETNYKQKIDTGVDLPAADVVEIFREDFRGREKETAWAPGEDPGALADLGVKAVGLYQIEVAPTVQPLMVEKEFESTFSNTPLILQGRIDLVDDNDVLRDMKTTGKSPSAGEADRSLQLSLYGVGYKAISGEYPKGYQLDHIVKTKTPKIVCNRTTRTEADIARALAVVGLVDRAITSGIFPPADPNHWVCSEKWCGYWNRCGYGGGDPRQKEG